jgi:nucleoside-diphosphate-sugar epimerase
MKVIVTGCTGLVGSALVRQCVANDNISQVFALTRKPLPEAVAKSPKVTVILHNDFSTYPPELLDQLAGAEGCLWWAVSLPLSTLPRVIITICKARGLILTR